MNEPTTWEILLWVVLPYAALAIFIVGHIWRWRYDQFGWTSRSTQLQEKRALKWGAPLFHYATFAAIGGHVLGILIPASWISAIGVPENVYHWFAAIAGNIAAILVIIGVVVLAARRMFVARVRASTTGVDYLALILLLVIILTGIVPTMVNMVHAYDYRETVSPWFRSLFAFQTSDHVVNAMATAPVIYQIHAASAWLIWAVWPFTRLVHAWSYPLWYLWRPYVLFRSRKAKAPNEPGTGGRKWRRIGVPY
jgi:nitrate reductase gamma subunit